MRAIWLTLFLCACTPSGRPPALHDDPQALAYRSRTRVPDAAAQHIAAEAVGDARRRPAWSEPNHVHAADGPFGDGKDKYVFGEARLFLGEYETDPGKFREVDASEDASMALADAAFTLGQLREWAASYGVEWDVQLGAVRGKVTAQGNDAGAAQLLAELAKRAGKTAAEAEAARAATDAKYRDRR